MTRQNRGGRPPKTAAEKRDYSINIRLNWDELVEFKSAARSAGLTDSEYARQAMTRCKITPRHTPEMVALLRKLCGMDNNLNQLARQANLAGFASAHEETLRTANRVNNLINDLRK